jgi:Lrp/AsnC family transcriptional regulator, regulator for asnA, asnC and gidA
MAKHDPIELDALSYQIIVELQRDGRASFREIGKRLRVSPGTVRARYAQLRAAGIVEVIAIPNPWRMGMDFHATVGLRLQPGSAESAVALLAKKREVGWIALVLTTYDVMFEVAMSDSHAFGEFKQLLWAEIPGFISADVFAMWDVRKFRYEFGTAEPQKSGAADRKVNRKAARPVPKSRATN